VFVWESVCVFSGKVHFLCPFSVLPPIAASYSYNNQNNNNSQGLLHLLYIARHKAKSFFRPALFPLALALSTPLRTG